MQPQHLEGQNQASAAAGETKLGSLLVFNQNHHFAYIYKKTEKLVTAVYMITNFIKDNEPLKWRIREKALDLLDLNMSFNTVSLSDRKDLLKQYQAHSVEIVSLSSIAHHSGLISQMNFEVLKREFDGLVSTIEKDENKKANEETVILNPSFFDLPREKRENEASAIVAPAPIASTPVASTTSVAPTVAAPDVLKKSTRPIIKDISKDDRQGAIIKLLSKKSGLSIKDFIQTIKGVSEKTIQRELLAMVAAGVLKKEGERRWSTYSLA